MPSFRIRTLLLGFSFVACVPEAIPRGASASGGENQAEGGSSGTGGGVGGHGGTTTPSFCQPGSTESCGPSDNPPLGMCAQSTKTCSEQGDAWSECVPDVPAAEEEDCSTEGDDDCDGEANENCDCFPPDERECYTGSLGTINVGLCHRGTQVCGSDYKWGECVGEQVPAKENCATFDDEDCDASEDLEDGCVCTPGAVESCTYGGPQGTEGHGVCIAGTKTCNELGTGYSDCSGEVAPSDEICGDGLDQDCDDAADDGCTCTPETSQSCYTGAESTKDQGLCVSGTQTCNETGTAWGECTGQTLPSTEDCSTPEDEDCDGGTLDPEDGCVCVPNTTVSCYTGPDNTENVGQCKGGTKTCEPDGKSYGSCSDVTPTAEDCRSANDEDCDGSAPICAPLIWAKSFGGSDNDTAMALAATSTGSAILVGSYTDYAEFGSVDLTSPAVGGIDGFVALTDSNGSVSWAQNTYSYYIGETLGVALDSSNRIGVAGYNQGDLQLGTGTHVVELSSDGAFGGQMDTGGNANWVKQFADDYGLTYAVAFDSSGNAYFGGYFSGTAQFGTQSLTSRGGYDAFLIKYSSGGTFQWAKQYGGAGDDFISGLAVRPTSNTVIATGSFEATARFQSAATPTYTAVGDSDGFVVELSSSSGDATGMGVKTWGDANYEEGSAVLADSEGIVTSEYSQSSGRYTIKKRTYSGSTSWEVALPISAYGYSTMLAQDTTGVYVAGKMSGTGTFGNMQLVSSGGTDAVLVKLTTSGTVDWAERFGGAGDDAALGVALDGLGHAFLTGSYSESASFEGTTLTSKGGLDIFLLKLSL